MRHTSFRGLVFCDVSNRANKHFNAARAGQHTR